MSQTNQHIIQELRDHHKRIIDQKEKGYRGLKCKCSKCIEKYEAAFNQFSKECLQFPVPMQSLPDEQRREVEGLTFFHSLLGLANTRMIVCASCGNKRCPHAQWHRYKCTQSNEPGQVDVLQEANGKGESNVDIE